MASPKKSSQSKTIQKKTGKKSLPTKVMARKIPTNSPTKKLSPKSLRGSKSSRVKTKSVRSTVTKPTSQPGFPIVGIGASAGGLEAFEEFFTEMSPNSGLAFVVVPHQHPGHVSLLPGLLQKCTTMPILEVVDNMRVKPDTVYLALAGTNLAIFNGTLHLLEIEPHTGVHLPIDYFFRSLAEDQKHQAIGIVLSGTGSDGTLGLKAIKGESGMTMAQEPKSAKYSGMPHSAILTGSIDYVLPPIEMPAQLLAYVRGPYLTPVSPLPGQDADTGDILQKIFVLLRDRTGNDFSLYKSNTIRRRLERRMNVHQIEDPKHYIRYLLRNPHEVDLLFQEALIGVTSFFRDPLAFEALVKIGLPALLDSKREGDQVRVWVPGCSTGEEAYSLAMLIKEYMAQRKVRFQVQVFGTDLDVQAIETARKALYPAGIANDVTPERLQRFFTKEEGDYRVKKDLRDLAVFAPHNLLADPPFTKLDLLSCRNLLIYLEPRAQRQVFPLFQYALKPHGLLFLGSSESIGEAEEQLFATLEKKWKLYRRKPGEVDRITIQGFPVRRTKRMSDSPKESDLSLPVKAPSTSNLIEVMLLDEYAPASVIVDERGEIVYIHGRTGAYLEPAPGQPTLILLNMAREGLRYDLAAALHEVGDKDIPVERQGVRVKTNGSYVKVDLTVKRVHEPEPLRGLLLVTFVPQTEEATLPSKAKRSKNAKQRRVDTSRPGLVQELQYTKQRLQHTIEEHQTVNEELKSTNEELQSTNEELQSTNEELETSKEELQSLNEELMTVNAELQGKMNELSDVNDDLDNLLNSLEIATIFLDHDLNIKRFTPEAKRVVKLIAADVGRPLADIVSTLVDDSLIEDAQEVFQTLVAKEREVQSRDGQWYFLRILPYRTAKNTIEGLVLTFLDITQQKEATAAVAAARDARELAESMMQTVREPLLVLDAGLRVKMANRAFYQTFKCLPGSVEQQPIFELDDGQWQNPALRQLLEKVVPANESFQDFLVEHTFPRLGKRKFLLNARRLIREPQEQALILLAMEDITLQEERKREKEEA
jgi:two-component system, chemotaxis family, CheB/CheR fusion protein